MAEPKISETLNSFFPESARVTKMRLTEYRRKDRAHKKVFYGAIGGGCSVTLAVALGALPEAGFAVFRLAYAGKKSIPDDLHGIERALGNDLEFLSGG